MVLMISNDDKITLHDLRVALTGKNKKTEKCLAMPKLLQRSNSNDYVVPTINLNDSSSGTESNSSTRQWRPSIMPGPSSSFAYMQLRI